MTISRKESLAEAKDLLGEWVGNDHLTNQNRYLRAIALALVALVERGLFPNPDPPAMPVYPGWPPSHPYDHPQVLKQKKLDTGVPWLQPPLMAVNNEWPEPSAPVKQSPDLLAS